MLILGQKSCILGLIIIKFHNRTDITLHWPQCGNNPMLFPLPSKLPSGNFNIIYGFYTKRICKKLVKTQVTFKWMLSIWQIILTSKDILHLRRWTVARQSHRLEPIFKKTRENSNHISPFDIFRRLNLQRHFTVHLRWRTPSRQSHRLEHIAQCPQRCSPDQAGTPHQPFQTERNLAQCGYCVQTIKKSRGRRTGTVFPHICTGCPIVKYIK